ncbi:disks large-associated protein 4-like [Paramacrobiotus metropolitanus]|uniref:disks large-associated protein 4-like n=1 Tax=Paramacrobiotus metropolitanus TaxID=2943436 RepID=UPI0024460BB6|nr:disks large-associated protein 4-like [Paramacrobiotus metropolitanus]XP_055336994.1 disks large-associated protein 4-like [Paramacrobiotus metropolitanus]
MMSKKSPVIERDGVSSANMSSVSFSNDVDYEYERRKYSQGRAASPQHSFKPQQQQHQQSQLHRPEIEPDGPSTSHSSQPSLGTLKVNRSFIQSGSPQLSSVDARANDRPIKGILVNQGYRSQESTPRSTPRLRIEPDWESQAQEPLQRAGPALRTIRQSHESAEKARSRSSGGGVSVVADFLRKFSPKIGRSKKALQWYTVDIQPSAGLSVHSAVLNGKHNNSSSVNVNTAPHIAVEPDECSTLRELQNGRISTEFSAEMTECLRHTGAPPPETAARGGRAPSKAREETDFRSGKYVVHLSETTEKSSSKSKTLPATGVTTSSPWRAMVVDIDIDKRQASPQPAPQPAPSGSQSERSQFFQSMQAGGSLQAQTSSTSARPVYTSAEKKPAQQPPPHQFRPLDFNIPDYFQGSASYLAAVKARDTDLNRHIPSYIQLSRALNGYSARNLYTPRKLVSSRDYNQLLCKSEEYLHRRTGTPTPTLTTPTPLPSFPRSPSRGTTGTPGPGQDVYQAPHSARQLRSHSAAPPEVRRAASEDRDLSLVGLDAPPPPPKPARLREVVRKPGHEFLEKLEGERARLQALCDEGSVQLQTNDLNDEIADQLRAAIGKTQLLLSQKFQQFRKLCQKNIEESEDEPLKTGTGDLLGFWEMMAIQTADVERMFGEVERLRAAASSGGGALSFYQTPSSDGSDAAPPPAGAGPTPSTSKSPQHGVLLSAGAGGQRRGSKPKVTFQLNERDVQRRELIAAKRRAFEAEKRQGSGSGSGSGSSEDSSAPSVAGSEELAPAPEDDVHIFLPANAATLQVT